MATTTSKAKKHHNQKTCRQAGSQENSRQEASREKSSGQKTGSKKSGSQEKTSSQKSCREKASRKKASREKTGSQEKTSREKSGRQKTSSQEKASSQEIGQGKRHTRRLSTSRSGRAPNCVSALFTGVTFLASAATLNVRFAYVSLCRNCDSALARFGAHVKSLLMYNRLFVFSGKGHP